MIDFLSLILSHMLMLFVALRVVVRPDLNEEPTPYGRRFKHVGKMGKPRA